MFELHVTDKNVSTGSIAVGWCVSKETLDKLHAHGNKTPHVVLVIAPHEDEYQTSREIRKIVPLKDLVAYLEFNRSGKMNIWGFIATEPAVKHLKDRWLHKSSYGYLADILTPSGREYSDIWSSSMLEKAEPVAVEIPQQAFAKEPPAWEKNWVNHFFGRKPEDQCQFRRRRLFAYTIQPLLMLGDFSSNSSLPSSPFSGVHEILPPFLFFNLIPISLI